MPGALREMVVEELRWDPRVDTTKVTVKISAGRAILQGSVHTYAEKCRCEQIVKGIRGITAVRNAIDVHLTIGDYRPDTLLYRLATDVIECIALLPQERPQVTVAGGQVTLEGTVAFAFQKRLAEEAIGLIAGVRTITNRINVARRPCKPQHLETALRSALQRNVPRKRAIKVEAAEGGRITLRGTVLTCAEKDHVLDLVWCAPGVTIIKDHLRVRP